MASQLAYQGPDILAIYRFDILDFFHDYLYLLDFRYLIVHTNENEPNKLYSHLRDIRSDIRRDRIRLITSLAEYSGPKAQAVDPRSC
jgi:hypothetical protein